MSYGAHVCSFSGSLADLPRKLHRDADAVLAVLREHPRFSVWDATATRAMASTLDRLKRDGRIRYLDKPEYPWVAVEVIEHPVAEPKPTPDRGIDVRTITLAIRRAMFARRFRCSFRVERRNRMVATGETWTARESCGDLAVYALIVNGRVSARCEAHARDEAKKRNCLIDERLMIERPA